MGSSKWASARSSSGIIYTSCMSKARSRKQDGDDEAGNPFDRPTETIACGSPNSLVIGLDCRSMNLYRFLRVRFPDVERAILQDWISRGLVLVNGSRGDISQPLRAGDAVDIKTDVSHQPKRKSLTGVTILHQDQDICVVNKPSGLSSAPERNPKAKNLLDWLRQQVPADAGAPKLVHRIDKHASGVVVFALTRDAKRTLIEDFSARRVTKDYLAIAGGPLEAEPHVLKTLIHPARGRRTRMAIHASSGKEAITLLRGAVAFRGFTAVHARPVTGRTHQIRVHLHTMGCPIVGDDLYEGLPEILLSELKPDYHRARGEKERPLLKRLGLHATRIEFPHPAHRDPVTFTAPLPREMVATLKRLQKFAGTQPDEHFNEWLAAAPMGPGDDPFAGVWKPDAANPAHQNLGDPSQDSEDVLI